MNNSNNRWVKGVLGIVTLCAIVFSSILPAFAASAPQFLKDINTNGQDTEFFDDGGYPVTVNGVAYYTFYSPLHGDELWKSDGTESGTVMVKDIYPGTRGSEPHGFHVLDNKLIFIADHPDYGEEIWISDGTESGTQLLKDVTLGEEDGDVDNTMFAMGGELYFVANNDNDYDALWKTDGTTLGTVMVGDPQIAFSSDDYYLELMGASSTDVFARMYDYDNGYTSFLIKYDGTFTKVTDVSLDPIDNVDNEDAVVLNDDLIFERCASEGCEPWIYNSGTGYAEILLDVTGNSTDSNPEDFTILGTTVVVFSACANGWGNDCEMWTTDGTTLGTTQLVDINTGSDSSWPDVIATSSTKAYFQGRNSDNLYELWVTDGTSGGTSKVYELSWEESDDGIEDDAGEAIIAGGKLYFQMCTGEDYDCELFATNADDTGVYMVRDIWEGTNGDSDPDYFVEIAGGIVLFGAENLEYGYELWRTDGTENGTMLVKDITTGTQGSETDDPVALGDKVVFIAYNATYGTELWISDGTESGTQLLKDIYPGSSGAYPYYLYSYNGKVYFNAETEDEGRELWVTDGTPLGTQLVKNIRSGNGSSDPYMFTGMGDYVYFRAYNDDSTYSLWRTDGTESGTTEVKKLDPSNSNLEEIMTDGERIFFRGYTPATSYELWVSDGTESGTVLLKDIVPGSDGSYPAYMHTGPDGIIYFAAYTGATGSELWVTDGTESGTVLLKDIASGGSGSNPVQFTTLGNHVYFVAYSDDYGTELWKTDGTEEGTVLVSDIRMGTDSSYPYELTRMGDHIYFEAETQDQGYELWKTDGTEEGTEMVKDINTEYAQSSYIEHLTVAGDRLYFVAESEQDDDGNENVELWVTDGTESGTEQVADIYPGARGSFPHGLTVFDDKLFFFAESIQYGSEPYVITDLNIIDEAIEGCTNPNATNYDADATSDDGSCVLPTTSVVSSGGGRPWSPATVRGNATSTSTTTPATPTTCPADQTLTQNLRSGSRNGRYNAYTRGIVREAKILQAHLNRLGFNSGPVDGILGRISDGAIKRMQTYLGTKADGFVGPKTRALINNSCGDAGLVRAQS